jgi:pSer/pThr/pTyr-binding forkhead associated (FHA) protein
MVLQRPGNKADGVPGERIRQQHRPQRRTYRFNKMPKSTKTTIQLVHLTGPLKGKVQHFSSFPIKIGRHIDCQVQFDESLSAISRFHAHIDCREDQFRIVDTSTNGTYVNGKRIADVYLKDGDEITFSLNGPTAGFLIPMESPIGTPSASFSSNDDLDADLTIGPEMCIAVVETKSTLLVQFNGAMQVFKSLPITLGAAPSCDVQIDTDGIQDQHLQIFFNEGDYYLEDMTEMMLVTINGRPIGTQSILAKGATVSLGEKGPTFRLISDGKLVEVT